MNIQAVQEQQITLTDLLAVIRMADLEKKGSNIGGSINTSVASLSSSSQTKKSVTYARFYKEWIKSKTKLSPATKSKYNYLYHNHIDAHLGDKLLTEIKPSDIAALIEIKKEELASSIVKEIVCCVLRQSLKYAEGLGYIDKNVAKYVDIPTVEQNHGRAMTNDEIKRLLEEAHKHRLGISIDLLLYTGMRRGELLGLRWDDIDHERGTIRIERAFVRSVDKRTGKTVDVIGSPKTKKSAREIAIPKSLIETLRAYKKREERAGRGGYKYLLSKDGSDEPYNTANFSRLFRKWRDTADVGKDIHIHSLRHTYCTLMHEAGVDNYTLIQQTGHVDTRMLERVYLHKRNMKMQENAVAKYEAKLQEILL